MIFDLVKNIEICFMYRSEAPLTLIYYSHISTAIVAIFIGLFVHTPSNLVIFARSGD